MIDRGTRVAPRDHEQARDQQRLRQLPGKLGEIEGHPLPSPCLYLTDIGHFAPPGRSIVMGLPERDMNLVSPR